MNLRVQSLNFDTNRSIKFQRQRRKYHYALHVHQFAELVFSISGELTLLVDDRRETLKPGEAAFISPFQPHGYESDCLNDVGIFVFSPALLPDFFESTGGRRGMQAVFTPQRETLDIFKNRIFDAPDFDLLEIKGAVYLALGDYASQTEFSRDAKVYDIASSVVAYINEHLAEDISIQNLADGIGYSTSFVSRRIKSTFGVNLASLVAAIRLDKAIDMLGRTDMGILEISYACGFGSQQSFNRIFKSFTGKTPREYRAVADIKPRDEGIVKYF